MEEARWCHLGQWVPLILPTKPWCQPPLDNGTSLFFVLPAISWYFLYLPVCALRQVLSLPGSCTQMPSAYVQTYPTQFYNTPPSTRPPHPRLANRRPLKIGAHRTPLCRAARNRWSDTFQREASLPVSSRGDYFSAWKTESAGKSVIRGLGPSCPVRTGTDNVTSLVTIQRVFLSIQRTIVDNYTCY